MATSDASLALPSDAAPVTGARQVGSSGAAPVARAAAAVANACSWLRNTPWSEVRRTREVIAIAYCLVYIVLGFVVVSFGPAVLDLSIQTRSTVSEVGFCLGVRSFAYAVGAICGPVYDRVPGHYVLACALVLGGLATSLLTVARSVYGLGAIVALQGFSLCAVDTGANVLLLNVFAGDSKAMHPWMQALHFCFALGAFASPLLLRASAAAQGERTQGEVAAAGSYNAAFYTLGVMAGLAAAMMLCLESPSKRASSRAVNGDAAAKSEAPVTLLTAPDTPQNALDDWKALVPDASAISTSGDAPSDAAQPAHTHTHTHTHMHAEAVTGAPDTASAADTTSITVASTPPASMHADGVPANCVRDVWRVVCVSACVFAAYVGAETAYGFYSTAYGVFALGMTEAEGQYLTSAYWGAIMAGRLAAVPISMWVTPSRMLDAVLVGCVASILLLLAFRASVVLTWMLTVVYGLCMASVFPTVVALLEGFFPVLGKHATVFVAGAAFGEWALPFIVSLLIGATVSETGETVVTDPSGPGPAIVPVVVCAGTIATALFYIITRRMGAALALKIKANTPPEARVTH